MSATSRAITAEDRAGLTRVLDALIAERPGLSGYAAGYVDSLITDLALLAYPRALALS